MLLDGVRVHELTPVKAIRVGVGLYKKTFKTTFPGQSHKSSPISYLGVIV